ncbi:unnamed protein product, partial [Prorocentrum cordatum]
NPTQNLFGDGFGENNKGKGYQDNMSQGLGCQKLYGTNSKDPRAISTRTMKYGDIFSLTCSVGNGYPEFGCRAMNQFTRLKPASALLSDAFRVKVCDFGLARCGMQFDAEARRAEQPALYDPAPPQAAGPLEPNQEADEGSSAESSDEGCSDLETAEKKEEEQSQEEESQEEQSQEEESEFLDEKLTAAAFLERELRLESRLLREANEQLQGRLDHLEENSSLERENKRLGLELRKASEDDDVLTELASELGDEDSGAYGDGDMGDGDSEEGDLGIRLAAVICCSFAMAFPADWTDDIEQRASRCNEVANAPVAGGHNAGTGHNIALTGVFKNMNCIASSSASHAVDVFAVDGATPAGEIGQTSRTGGPFASAEPRGLKGELGTTPTSFSLLLVPGENSKRIVVKQLCFPDKVDENVAANLCTGTPMGFQIRASCLEELQRGGGHGHETAVYTDEGLDYIVAKAQEVLSDRRQLGMARWIHMEAQDEASPILNWPHGTIEKALNTIATEGYLAKVLHNWLMTLAVLEPSLLRALKMIGASLGDASIACFGVPGAGKTPASIAVALTRSRGLGGGPSCASEIGVFRQLVSTPKCPVMLGNFDSSSVPAKAMEVFLDVAVGDRATWAMGRTQVRNWMFLTDGIRSSPLPLVYSSAGWGMAEKCACCSYPLASARETIAARVDLTGTRDAIHALKRCSNKFCRVRHGYNYYVINGQHVNTLSARDMKDGLLFASAARAWATRYLQCRENLFFRGVASSRSVEWSHEDAFSAEGLAVDFRKQHNDAMLYFMAVKGSVEELVADGHQKARALSCHWNGATSAAGDVGCCTRGWFMAIDASSHQIFTDVGDEISRACFGEALPLRSGVNCLIMGRARSFAPSASKDWKYKQLKHYSVGKFHRKYRVSACKRNPHRIDRLERRLSKVNSSIAEITVVAFLRGKGASAARKNRGPATARAATEKKNKNKGKKMTKKPAQSDMVIARTPAQKTKGNK